jgi:molybdopterin converting factor small subunit
MVSRWSGRGVTVCNLNWHFAVIIFRNGNQFGDDGKLRSFVNVYVNDEDIRCLQKEATKVSEKDVVNIVPSIAGGS